MTNSQAKDSNDVPIESPGPLTYQPSFTTRSPPKFSISAKLKDPKQFNSPGPANYETNSSTLSPIKLTASPRYKQIDFFTNGPGPASYNIIERSKSPLFSISPKPLQNQKIEPRPSPVQYDIVLQKKSPSFSFKKQNRPEPHTNSPGPGTYTLKQDGNQVMFSMREKIVDIKPDIYKREKLGPGQFEIQTKENIQGGTIGVKIKAGMSVNVTLK